MSRPTRPTPADLRLLLGSLGSISAVARELGVSRATVRNWLQECKQDGNNTVTMEVPPPTPVEVPAVRQVELPRPIVVRPLPRRELPQVPVWVWQVALAIVIIWVVYGR